MKKLILYTLAIFATLSCNLDGMQTLKGKFYEDVPLHVQESEEGIEKEAGCIRLVQYNVGVFHKSGSSSINMVSDMMKEIETDIMSLNELDKGAKRTGYVDQLKVFAANMDWNYRFAATLTEFQGGEYGIGFAWNKQFNLKAFNKHDLPGSSAANAEKRAMAIAEFEDFIVVTTHLDLSTTRVQQAEFINSAIVPYAKLDKPIFLCGDFNDGPTSEAIKTIKQKWVVISEEANTTVFGNNCIDYIFLYNNETKDRVEVVKTKVLKNFSSGSVFTASDHLPVFVDFKLL